MSVRDRPNWLRLRFGWPGSILPQLRPQLVAALGFAVLVTLGQGQVCRWKVPLNFVPFSLIGLALAIIVLLFPLALFGIVGLAGIVLVHEVAEVVVILNGIRAAQRPAALSNARSAEQPSAVLASTH